VVSRYRLWIVVPIISCSVYSTPLILEGAIRSSDEGKIQKYKEADNLQFVFWGGLYIFWGGHFLPRACLEKHWILALNSADCINGNQFNGSQSADVCCILPLISIIVSLNLIDRHNDIHYLILRHPAGNAEFDWGSPTGRKWRERCTESTGINGIVGHESDEHVALSRCQTCRRWRKFTRQRNDQLIFRRATVVDRYQITARLGREVVEIQLYILQQWQWCVRRRVQWLIDTWRN